MTEETHSSDHQPVDATSEQQRLYQRLQERNARQQRQRQLKLERLAEQSAHHAPQRFRHPSR